MRPRGRRGTRDEDLRDEIRSHLEMAIRDRIERGESRADAQAAAHREFGNALQVAEATRQMWRWSALEQWFLEVRQLLRQLRRSPVFATVAVLSLALAIGANLALFSLTDTILLRSLPVKNPEQLVEFVRADRNSMMTNLPYPVYENLREDRAVLSSVFAIAASSEVLHNGVPQLTSVHEVSGSFFPTLGVPAYLGRAFGGSDDATAANPVAVLGYRAWARLFGSDPAIVGKSVRLSARLFTIVGVMPPEFFGVDRLRVPDLWIPLSTGTSRHEVWVLGRLKAGVSAAGAGRALEGRFREALQRVARPAVSEREREAILAQRLLVNAAATGTSGLRWTFWDYNQTLRILLGLGALVLLVACVNLANLLMARSAARSHEVGIRMAIGAGRWRIVRQLLTENIVLSLLAGCAGTLIAYWGHRLLLDYFVADRQSVALDFRIDVPVLSFGLVVSIAAGLLSSLVPVLRATRTDPAATLRLGGRVPGLERVRVARALLVGHVALSTILLLGAGLFVRSLNNLQAVDLGLARDELLLTDVRSSRNSLSERIEFWSQLPGRIARLPGVTSAALAGDAVFGNGGWRNTVWVESASGPPSEVSVSDNWVGAGFFATVGIPTRLGREFRDSDTAEAPLVAVVNEAFARRFWPGDSPIGKHFGNRGPTSARRYEVVGVVGNAKYGNVREQVRPMVFHPVTQGSPKTMTEMVLHVRGRDSASLRSSIRREVLTLDRDALVSDMRSTMEVLRDQLRQDRMFAGLSSLFASVALVLAAIGIYGVAAYRVERRKAEIGLRMALGAPRHTVLWLVSRETLALLVAGVILGVPLGLTAMRLVKRLLFGVEASDPAALCAAVVALFAIGGAAAYLPARRAASVDPVIALREE